MKERTGSFRWFRRAGPALAFAGVMAFALFLAAQPKGRPSRRPRGGRPSLVKVGTQAPDFELSRLTLVETKTGEKAGKISKEKVKLSDYRGKRVVCIFSSSYT